MAAIPIPQQEDELSDILRNTGAKANQSPAIPTGQVAGAPTAGAIPTDNLSPDAGQAPAPVHPKHVQSGVASLWSRAENIHNPVLRVLGKIGAGLARGIDIAGTVAAPGIAAAIPGSTMNANMGSMARQHQAEEDITNQQKQAVTAKTQQETTQAPQELALETRKQDLAEQVAANKPDASVTLQGMHAGAVQDAIAHGIDPAQSPKVQQLSDAITSLQKQPTPPKEGSPELQTYDSLVKGGMPPEEAYRKLHPEKPEPAPAGTWSLQEDASGKPVMFNSKTGATKAAPGDLSTRGTYEKRFGAGRDAVQYARDYLQSGNFTGPGDEALMEKFFEVAKPSTGFRMTQNQMDMLNQARSAYQGILARGKHLLTPNAPYFDDTQRQHIVKTMEDLGAAKEKAGGPATSGGGGAHSFTLNGKRYANVPDAVYQKYKGQAGFSE